MRNLRKEIADLKKQVVELLAKIGVLKRKMRCFARPVAIYRNRHPLHTSYRLLKKYFHDIFGLDISTGYLTKQIRKVSLTLEEPYEELVKQLVDELHLHCDGTGWKENGKPHWIWALRASMFSVFNVSESRGSYVSEDFPLQNLLRLIDKHRQTFLQTVQQSVPEDKDCRNIAKRFTDFAKEYFLFIDADIPPTNNLAEQIIRGVVTDRKITQGSRSDWGNAWIECAFGVSYKCVNSRDAA